MIDPTITVGITTGGFTALRLPANVGCSCFSIWTEDAAAYELSSDSAGADAITVPAGLPFSIEKGHVGSVAGTILCYAKGTSSTNLVGIITK